MAKRAIYEEFDAAVDRVMEDTTPRNGDFSDLVELAGQLKQMPNPEFRAMLRSNLQDHALFMAAGRSYRPERRTSTVLQMPRPMFASGPATYPVSGRNFALSLGVHVIVLALLLGSGAWFVNERRQVQVDQSATLVDPSLYVLTVTAKLAGGGGGGGDRDKMIAPQGRLPKQAMEQIAPPTAVLRNSDPKLSFEPTVVAPSINIATNMPNLGDPMSRIPGLPSNGMGSGGGIGSGSGGGIGAGYGVGVGPGYGGGVGGGVYRVGGGVIAPRILFAPDPDYSEEARKAKYQGTVVLWLVVDSNGRARDARVQRSLGMGLDEKALAAVRQWRFEPALKDGHPVAVQINVEVNFRMY
jgi:TonB family protein